MKTKNTTTIYSLSTIQNISGLTDKELKLAVSLAKVIYLGPPEVTHSSYFEAIDKIFENDLETAIGLVNKGFFSDCGYYPSVMADPILMAIADRMLFLLEPKLGSTH